MNEVGIDKQPLRVLNKDLTMAVVYCVYAVLNDSTRPKFGNDFNKDNV